MRNKPIYTLDIETDPFEYKRDPKPFAVGFYTGDAYHYTWGDNCIEEMHAIVQATPPGIIYAHNGGKFDFFFLMDWIANKRQMLIINGRIVRCDLYIENSDKFHDMRDSYAIMPFALKTYEKEEIDMRLLERKNREKNKQRILRYLKRDCTSLHELCTAFHDMFGDNITIGSTSMKQLRKLHDFECLSADEDERIRTPYYYGGRVQCFEKGILKPDDEFLCYDINQSYPNAMRNFLHPIGRPSNIVSNEITERTYFLTVRGRNYGAFPQRTSSGLSFTVDRGEFSVTIHEYNAALETGLFEMEDCISCVDFDAVGCFATFVDRYHSLRREAQVKGDKIGALFYKYVGNSAYGKFAQSPDNYYNYLITDSSTNMNPWSDPDGYYPCTLIEFANYILWRKHSDSASRYNVATGASITGAARAVLLRAIARAKRPVYCDTDSIVCESVSGVPFDDTKIGAWKLEKRGDKMAIAGRKLYALFQGKECVKMASKGVHLTPDEILQVAKGKTVMWHKDAPTFDFKEHTMKYISRTIKMT